VTLRILTLNVWGLPWPVGTHVPARIAAIGDALPSLAPDVAAFQEAWTADTRIALAQAGRRAGLAHAFPDPSGPRQGGLLVLSRDPLRDARFVPYTLNGFPERIDHADYWGGKGYISAEIGSAEDSYAFVATHMHARYAARGQDPYVGHRMAQVVELSAALRALPGPLVAVGDFNFEEGFEEHAVLTGLTGLEDVARALDRREDTVRWAGSVVRPLGRGGARVDYAFIRSGRGASLRPLAIERVLDRTAGIAGRTTNYSDHAGLLVELALAPGASASPALDPEAPALARRVLLEGRSAAATRRSALRWTGAGGLAVAAVALRPALRTRLTRRQLLGGSIVTLAALAGGGCLLLSEEVRPAELDAFDAVLRRLDALGVVGTPDRRDDRSGESELGARPATASQ
jgi:endonuclease/exonuclease/phosphatase family metal-dependent hydrolase